MQSQLQSQSQSQPQHDFIANSGSETDLLIPGGPPSIVGDPLNVLEAAELGAIDLNYQNGNGTNNDHHHSRSQLVVLGIDISDLSRKTQFITCATGVFGFSLVYGYLQELISVTLCNRQLGLFLAMIQFTGYTFLSSLMFTYVSPNKRTINSTTNLNNTHKKKVPIRYYLFLAFLRAIDAALTNMAMAYINYPAKTLMKSSRVVFTMIFGTLFGRKTYSVVDYSIGTLMVSGLVVFMHADANSSAIFEPIGITMLTVSLLCDGAVSNLSEQLMNQYDVGQDEFIYHLYSITTLGILAAATIRGDLTSGLAFFQIPGTLSEIENGLVDNGTFSWSVGGKVFAIVIFSTAGFFGSSCSAAITKEFGALTMSITSTARKATTLFLSFALFNHVCTLEHVVGTVLFITALVAKSLKTSRGGFIRSASTISLERGVKKASSTDNYNSGRVKRRRNPRLIESV